MFQKMKMSHRVLVVAASFLIAGSVTPGQTPERLVKIVYCVPADRNPHEGYSERLDYLFKKLCDFYMKEMESSGYVDGSGKGKTFELETDLSKNAIVHLIDHSPDGNYPDPSRTVNLYRDNVGVWTGKDIAQYLPSDFGDDSVLVILTDMTQVQSDHLVHYGTNGGMGESGPGKTGIVYLTDQILGIDETHTFDYPPRRFHAIGKNDAEQIAILKDTRCTNICDWARPFSRNAPTSWNTDECPDPANSMVWEYSTVVIGVVSHELGHALALPHCFRMKESTDPGVWGDYNIMGNGFRAIFASLFPDGAFSESEQYSRMSGDIAGFGTRVIINPRNRASLNRNQFMNSCLDLPDTDKPFVEIHGVSYHETGRYMEVDITARETTGTRASGLSHINYLLDWNVHKTVPIPQEQAFLEYQSLDILDMLPEEYALNWYVDWLFYKGIHTLTAMAMDYCGNDAAFRDSVYCFSIGEYRINDWMIWSSFFNANAIVGGSASTRDKLVHEYLSKPDTEIIARVGKGTGGQFWRRFHTGDFVNVTDKISYYFSNSSEGSYCHLCYASANLISNRDRTLVMGFGYNDFIQVFLNGSQVYVDTDFTYGHNAFDTGQYQRHTVTIREGENHLLVKIYNYAWDGGFHVFFEDTLGDPVELALWPPPNPDILSIRNSELPLIDSNTWVLY